MRRLTGHCERHPRPQYPDSLREEVEEVIVGALSPQDKVIGVPWRRIVTRVVEMIERETESCKRALKVAIEEQGRQFKRAETAESLLGRHHDDMGIGIGACPLCAPAESWFSVE